MKKKIIGLAVLLFILSVTVVTIYQVGQRQKYQGEAAGQQECGRCSNLAGKENCYVTWIDLDGGCDSDFYNNRDEKCPDSRCSGTPTPTPASCKVDADCGRGQVCYQSTVCNISVGGCTSTFECRERGSVPTPIGGFPPGPDGLWHCSGCSNIYDKTFARWASTIQDCESGIVEGSQKYTPNCGCSTPGKPLPTGISVDCSSSNPSLFQCSGCDMYKSTQRMFVEWLSRYPDCSDKVLDPANDIAPIYTQDLSCAVYAGQRATPTPTPMPEGECNISVANNPCTINNWTQTAGQGCGTMINWNSGSDIKICFNTGAMNQTQQSNPTYMSNTAEINPNLIGINGSYCYNYGSGTAGNGSKFITLDISQSPVTIEGIIDGVVKCSYTYTIVQGSGNVPIPSLAPADCKYEADGKTPICPNEGVPGSQVIGPWGCMPTETKCGAWFDACGCPGRFWCVDGRHANCYDDQPHASVDMGGQAKGDVNSDEKVDIIDIGIVIDHYGSIDPIADVNSDEKVDIVDIGIIIDNYGR